MTTIRFYVGEGFKALDFARTVLVPTFGGATVTESHGFWVAPDGKVWDEKGHVITLVVDSPESAATAIKFARRWAFGMGEQSIMVELGDGSALFEDALA